MDLDENTIRYLHDYSRRSHAPIRSPEGQRRSRYNVSTRQYMPELHFGAELYAVEVDGSSDKCRVVDKRETDLINRND